MTTSCTRKQHTCGCITAFVFKMITLLRKITQNDINYENRINLYEKCYKEFSDCASYEYINVGILDAVSCFSQST